MSSAECEAEQAAEEQQAAQLPDELVELVVARLPRSAQPAARLVSKAFEAAVAVRAVRLHEWPGSASSDQPPRVRPSLQRHLQSLEVPARHLERVEVPPWSRALTAVDWQLLGERMSQLPALRWLHIPGREYHASTVPAPVAAAFSSLVRLDLPIDSRTLPEGVTLPALRVASFSRTNGLSRINALAPQLRELQLGSLALTASCAANGSLPHVTHFSGEYIYFDDDGKSYTAAATAALGAALPALEVCVSLPFVVFPGRERAMHLAELLGALPSLRAMRARTDNLQLDDPDSEQLDSSAYQAALSRLQHLSLHDPRGWARCTTTFGDWPPAAAPQLSGLQHVVLALRLQGWWAAPDGSRALWLLRNLAALPALQWLVLPDSALCSECCECCGGGSEGLHAALAALARSPSLTRLEFAEIDGCDCACAHPPQQRAEGRAVVSATAAARAAPLALCFGQRREGNAGLHAGDAFGELVGGVFAAPVDEGSVWGELGPRAGQL